MTTEEVKKQAWEDRLEELLEEWVVTEQDQANLREAVEKVVQARVMDYSDIEIASRRKQWKKEARREMAEEVMEYLKDKYQDIEISTWIEEII